MNKLILNRRLDKAFALIEVLVVIGIIASIVSIAADYIGLGKFPGFGWKQIVGTIIGVVVIGIGLTLIPKVPKQIG